MSAMVWLRAAAWLDDSSWYSIAKSAARKDSEEERGPISWREGERDVQ
jgi:hypothetical protein